MAGVNLQYRIEDSRMRQALDQLYQAEGNAALAFRDIGEYLLISHDQRFRDQISPSGERWAPLSDRYRKRKKRNKDRILFLDGHLAGTLRYVPAPDHLLFGTNRIYGATQHFGDADRGIPERPWLGLSQADAVHVAGLLSRHYQRAMRR